MGTRTPRRATLGATLAATLLLGGCSLGGGSEAPVARSLNEVLGSIARSQDVDVTLVRTAVADEARTAGTGELAIAEQWDAVLPQKPLPKLQQAWESTSDALAEQLRASTCEAILDTLKNHEVPTGQKFFDDYLTGVATSRFPNAEERAIMAEFDSLNTEAEAGTLTETDIRFSLMKLHYC